MHLVKAILNRARLTAIAASVVGAVVFYILDLPLPFMLGPMFGCLIVALAGADLKGLGPLALAMRIVLGVAVGTAITPELMNRMPQMGYSLALVPPFILIIGLIGYPWFRKVCKFDHATAYFGAMPGGLQDMLIFGQEAATAAAIEAAGTKGDTAWMLTSTALVLFMNTMVDVSYAILDPRVKMEDL